MFNHDQYYEAVAQKRAELIADVDQSWRDTVHERYAEFLVEKVGNALIKNHHMLKMIYTVPHATERQKHRKKISAEMSVTVTELAYAVALIGHNCAVLDPVDAEARMRLYYEASRPPEVKNDG